MLKDRRFVTILLIIFVQLLGASMVLPILPLFAKREFEMPPQIITLLVSSFFAAQFLAGPYLGQLSDQYGRVPILIISQIGTVISFLMVAAATSPEMLFASRVLDGITGGNIIVAQAYVTDITPRDQRTQALGYTFAVFGLGFLFGPSTGGLLSALFGPRIPFIIAAIIATLTVILTWAVLDETRTKDERLAAYEARASKALSFKTVLQNHSLVLILLVGFGSQFGLGLVQSTFALYGEAVLFKGYSRSITDLGIGLLLGSLGLSQLFTQTFLLRRLLRRYGEARLVIIGTVLRGLAMLMWVIISTPFLGPFASFAFAAGSGLTLPALQSLATRAADDAVRGGVLGLFQSATSLSIICATASGGTLFALGPRVPFELGAVIFVLMLIPCQVLYRWSVDADLTTKVPIAPAIGP